MQFAILDDFFSRSIARDLLLGLTITVFIVSLFLGLAYHFWIFARDEQDLRNSAIESAENLAPIVALSLFKQDYIELGRIIQIFGQRENIVAVHVEDKKNNVVIKEGYAAVENLIIVSRPIIYLGEIRGSVEVFFTKDKLLIRQKENFYYALIIMLTTIIAINSVTWILLRLFLSNPLTSLTAGISSISSGSYNHQLPAVKQRYMNQIINQVNTMIRKIATRDKQMRNMVTTLEKQVGEQKRSEQKLFKYQEKLQLLSQELLLTEERERRRIASELHDRIGYTLTNISIRLGGLRQITKSSKHESTLNEINDLVQQSIQDTHTLIFDISPPVLYDFGLKAAIEWLIERTEKEHGLSVKFDLDEELKSTNDSFNVLIFGAIRELLFNIVKHAKADSASISIIKNANHLMIIIFDNGKGFDVKKIGAHSNKLSGFGLFSIKERLSRLNGHLEIESSVGKGTNITISVPMN